MSQDLVTLEMVARGIAIGALLAMAAGFALGGLRQSVRLGGFLFATSVIAYAINSSPVMHEALRSFQALDWLIHFFALGGVGVFWLFIVTLFEDRSVTPIALAPWFVLTGIGLLGIAKPTDERPILWVVHNLIEVAIAAHALFIVWRSWRGDLVEARRRMRGPFLAIVTVYVLTLSAFETAESLGFFYPWFRLLGAATLALYCLAGAAVFLEARSALFGVATPAQAPASKATGLDAGDRLTLDKLDAAMAAGAWRREGLTIGDLATEVGVPEHRLRPLINDHLGFRNFAAFVNARRIEAAKALLSDPAQARTTIAAIAFDLGFGSLGPFNRAFKEATGLTPTEFRRGETSPISENPG
jgi:AraC-like DNA-binding protein